MRYLSLSNVVRVALLKSLQFAGFFVLLTAQTRGFLAPNRGTINQQADFSSPGSTTKGTFRGSFFVVQRLVTEMFFVNFTFFWEKMHKYLRE